MDGLMVMMMWHIDGEAKIVFLQDVRGMMAWSVDSGG
jgi:hypothetical protein